MLNLSGVDFNRGNFCKRRTSRSVLLMFDAKRSRNFDPIILRDATPVFETESNCIAARDLTECDSGIEVLVLILRGKGTVTSRIKVCYLGH